MKQEDLLCLGATWAIASGMPAAANAAVVKEAQMVRPWICEAAGLQGTGLTGVSHIPKRTIQKSNRITAPLASKKGKSMKTCLAFVAATALMSAASARADSPLLVGMSVGTLGNPFFVAAAKGALDEARQSDPRAEVTTVSSDYDLNKQANQLDNFVTAGAQLVLLNAVDPRAIAPAIKRVQAAGVVVAAFDVGAAGANVTAMTDNVKAGQMSCQYLADKLGGKGNVIIVNGPQVTSVIDRVKGCEEVLGHYEGISILSDNQDGKVREMAALASRKAFLRDSLMSMAFSASTRSRRSASISRLGSLSGVR